MRDIYFIAKINNIYLLFFSLYSQKLTDHTSEYLKEHLISKDFRKKIVNFWSLNFLNFASHKPFDIDVNFYTRLLSAFSCSAVLSKLTPRLSGGPTALKSIFRETSFSNQLHDFSLLSWNSFLHSFLESKFTEKNSDSLGVKFMNQALIEIFYFAANCFPISEKMFETRALTSFN